MNVGIKIKEWVVNRKWNLKKQTVNFMKERRENDTQINKLKEKLIMLKAKKIELYIDRKDNILLIDDYECEKQHIVRDMEIPFFADKIKHG